MHAGSKRTYLAVPYAERDRVKALGAKWDPAAKRWYALAGVDIAPFERWIRAAQSAAFTDGDPRVEFKAALKDAGLIVEGLPEMDGRLIRVRVEGDKGKERSGTYLGHGDGHPAGHITNFRTGHAGSWRASAAPADPLTVQDRARLAAEAAATRAQREHERDHLHADVAGAIGAHWSAAVRATAAHPYLRRKGTDAYGVRVDQAGTLPLPPGAAAAEQQSFSRAGNLLPLRDMGGALWAVQSIDPSGFKSLPKGGRYLGLHHLIGDVAGNEAVLVAEGYATGTELHRETGLPVAVAFSSSNIEAVARAYRERFPDLLIIVAGDDDRDFA